MNLNKMYMDTDEDSQPRRKRVCLGQPRPQIQLKSTENKALVKKISPFKIVKALYAHGDAEGIYKWFCYAPPDEQQLTITYAINQMFELKRLDLVNDTFTFLNVNYQTINNLELGILLVKFYLFPDNPYLQDTETAWGCAYSTVLRLDKNPEVSLIRKRHIELLIDFCREHAWYEMLLDLFYEYYVLRFGVQSEDVYLNLNLKTHLILKWIVDMRLYFPIDMGHIYKLAHVTEIVTYLKKVPIDMSKAIETISKVLIMPGAKSKTVNRLRASAKTYEDKLSDLFRSSLSMSAPAPLLDQSGAVVSVYVSNAPDLHYHDVKFVIDGANVLFSFNGQPKVEGLIKTIRDLSIKGYVVVVLHQRHFKNGIVHIEMFSIPNVSLCITPFGINDDYYSLLIAMTNNCTLVTNDLYRDHYKLDNNVERWCKENLASYDEALEIDLPLPFSHCVQYSEDTNTYFLPTIDPNTWIVI